jgi:L-fuculose-phosphate aldolase
MTSTDQPRPDAGTRRERGPDLGDLPPAVKLVLLARCLHREGYDEHVSGHVSWKQADGTFLVDARGIPWDLLGPEDVVTMDADGSVVAGRWDVSPALALHRQIHARRADVGVIVHHHSRYGTVWAAAGRIPPVYDQTSALLDGGLVLYEAYEGSVGEAAAAASAADALGDASAALLGQHGVLVVGAHPAEAFARAAHLEWRCRIAWHVEVLGGGATPMRADQVEHIASAYAAAGAQPLFTAMARRVLRDCPSLWSGPIGAAR